MGAANRLLTTSRQEIRQVPKIKAYLDRKSRNSGNTADSYLRALALVQEFLNTKYINNRGHGKKPISVNHLDSVFLNGNNNKKKAQVDVYAFLDSFVSYCSADRGLSPNTTELYLHGVKGFLEHCDIEINPAKFKNRVTMPKNRREDAQAIDDSDIRKLLLACTNLRLKAYLLILASGALRAREALGLRLCDVNFSLTPTKVHVRAENAKTKVPRDIYISEEATRYLKQFIAWKYSAKTASGQLLRQQTQDDLIFRIHNQNELGAK